jgi:hypothetical protein
MKQAVCAQCIFSVFVEIFEQKGANMTELLFCGYIFLLPFIHLTDYHILQKNVCFQADLRLLNSAYKVILESSWSVIVVTALVKEDEKGCQDHTSTSLFH